jgi:hypothetical protein
VLRRENFFVLNWLLFNFLRVVIFRPAIGILRRRWEDNNKMDLRGIGCGGIWLRIETSGGLL